MLLFSPPPHPLINCLPQAAPASFTQGTRFPSLQQPQISAQSPDSIGGQDRQGGAARDSDLSPWGPASGAGGLQLAPTPKSLSLAADLKDLSPGICSPEHLFLAWPLARPAPGPGARQTWLLRSAAHSWPLCLPPSPWPRLLVSPALPASELSPSHQPLRVPDR